MNDLFEMRRVLWTHAWDAPAEWAAAVRRLAELSDDEIRDLPAAGNCDPDP